VISHRNAPAPKPSRDSVEQACEQYRQELRRFFERRAPQVDCADDLVQLVYLRLLRSPPLASVNDPRRFMYRVAWNVLRDEQPACRAQNSSAPSAAILNVLKQLADSPRITLDRRQRRRPDSGTAGTSCCGNCRGPAKSPFLRQYRAITTATPRCRGAGSDVPPRKEIHRPKRSITSAHISRHWMRSVANQAMPHEISPLEKQPNTAPQDFPDQHGSRRVAGAPAGRRCRSEEEPYPDPAGTPKRVLQVADPFAPRMCRHSWKSWRSSAAPAILIRNASSRYRSYSTQVPPM